MIIRASTLVNRFYTADGWTRELVASLLNDPDIKHVEPRWLVEYPENSTYNNENNITYFSVYENAVPHHVNFLRSEIDKHEYEPYSDLECDQDFSSKNRVQESHYVNDGHGDDDDGCDSHTLPIHW